MNMTVLEIPKPAWEVTARLFRREAEQNAERALREAADRLREYQGDNYSQTPFGLCVRVDHADGRDLIDAGHRSLVLALSAAHDKHQAALKSYAEVA